MIFVFLLRFTLHVLGRACSIVMMTLSYDRTEIYPLFLLDNVGYK
jgi:hypothetical protein